MSHVIKLTDETPTFQAPYKVPHALEDAVEQEIQRLLSEDIITESDSEFSTAMVPVRKPNGQVRITADFKKLNAKTLKDHYQMTNPQDVLNKMAGRKYISIIDLESSFYQIPLDTNSQKYTAFQTPYGKFCFKRLPMGVKNGPPTLQRLISRILRGTGKYAANLLDDICIGSLDFESHLIHLRDILTRLRNARLTASTRKSHFLLRELTVLGHCLKDGVILPCDDKMNAIRSIRPPTTKRSVKALYGLINYYRHFCENFAETTACITQLLKRDQPDRVIWQKHHQEALEKIIQCLTSKPTLVAPNPAKDYIIQTDATKVSVAGILSQLGDDNLEHVVCYASKQLAANQGNWSTIEKELYAAVYCLTYWHQYLYGKRIHLYTDHRSILWLNAVSNSSHNARLARWILILQGYDIVWNYRKASLHTNVDSLSRLEMFSP